MNAPVRKPLLAEEEVRADPVEVFRLRCHSRAKLWHDGEIDLHSAVDELQHAAEASGLIDAIGQDAAQGLMAAVFAALRDDLLKFEDIEAEPTFADVHGNGPDAMTRYPQDRASVLATTLISVLVRRLRAPEVHAEIAQTLREEFHDIARQARDETRPSGE